MCLRTQNQFFKVHVMNKPAAPKRSRSKANSGKERLIAAGEKLIGEYGLEGLSLRQVSVEAGLRNHYAVQYHFGDADGLVRAIIASRSPELEERRKDILAQCETEDRLSTRDLLETFFRPLIESVGEDGIPHFARFTVALHRAPNGWQPLDEMMFLMPVTVRMLDLLQSANPHLPAPVIWQRMRPISLMVLTYACGSTVMSAPPEYRENVLENLLDMAAAALAVPVKETTAAKIYGTIF